MIHDIPMPKLSPNFTFDDIRAIRDWKYERLKDATVEEQLADLRAGAAPGFKQLAELRRQYVATHGKNGAAPAPQLLTVGK